METFLKVQCIIIGTKFEKKKNIFDKIFIFTEDSTKY